MFKIAHCLMLSGDQFEEEYTEGESFSRLRQCCDLYCKSLNYNKYQLSCRNKVDLRNY